MFLPFWIQTSYLLSFPNSLQKAIQLILFNHNYSQIWPTRLSIWNYVYLPRYMFNAHVKLLQ